MLEAYLKENQMFQKNNKPIDPMQLCKLLWPGVYMYKKQREIIYSVMENDVTVVPAGNMLGECPLL